MIRRIRLDVTGVVQGVGFRPFVYRLASSLALTGFVFNSCGGVTVELQGNLDSVDIFIERLKSEAPPLSRIDSLNILDIQAMDVESSFSIKESRGGEPLVQIPPDSSVCDNCLEELFDPSNRRYLHPFITCTDCGPRFSIIEKIPYDRSSTTMHDFPLCPACKEEYENPLSRRFHAEPLCCHDCGPKLTLVDGSSALISETPIETAKDIIRSGGIVAIKGTGGFHLAADACSDSAVRLLRERKRRESKPFAVMARCIEEIRELCETDALSEKLLISDQKPILLLRRAPFTPLSELVAPGNGWIGVMLPSNPLQHLLFHEGVRFMVMTSGNRSDEPIAAANDEALWNLKDIADAFLVHDRVILNRSDDSVMRVFRGNPLFYRRSRGFVPAALPLPVEAPPMIAAGAELKCAVSITRGETAFPAQHLGDVSSEGGAKFLADSADKLEKLLKITPEYAVHDSHPDFLSTRYAEERDLKLIPVQHHHAHFAACLGENREYGDAIGIIFDGTGIGEDKTVWGGEFLRGSIRGFNRFARFRTVCMPGGDRAVKEPWRMAASWLFEAFGDDFIKCTDFFPDGNIKENLPLILDMIGKRFNSPLTSSCGRLFDAVSSILGIRHIATFEGEAAIALEAAAENGIMSEPYEYLVEKVDNLSEIDFRPTVRSIASDVMSNKKLEDIALRFHGTVAAASVEICRNEAASSGCFTVALSGGVFQNRLLTEMLSATLESEGFRVLTHRLLPPNDGCISYGQAVYAGSCLDLELKRRR